MRRNVSEWIHRAQINKDFFDQAEGRGIFVDPVSAEARWYVEQAENLARHLRTMGNRTLEDMDTDESDFQQLLDELIGAKHNLL